MSKRLDAVLSASGMTRNEAQKMIKIKKVAVNGVITNVVSFRVEDGDEVTVDGKILDREKFIYLIMYKPSGYVSTTDNTEDSVMKLIPAEYMRKELAPVGRLDKDSEGLLLLSNDGEFAHSMISPKKNVEKLYYIETERPVAEEDCVAMSKGITLADGTECLPAELSPCSVRSDGNGQYAAQIILKEGKYHQVKRMIASRNNRVTRLLRLKVGEYDIEGMTEGEIRRFYPNQKGKN